MVEFLKKKQVEDEIISLSKKIKLFSVIRFCLFAVIVVFVLCFICLDRFALDLTLSLTFILLFSIFIIITNPVYHKLKLKKNLEYIYKKHENRRNLNYQSFTPDGREFIDYNDYKSLDLDLLGPRSLFQYLCVAKTKEGRSKLAKQLTNPIKKSKEFQGCVEKLAQSEETLRLEASLQLMDADAKDCDQGEMMMIAEKKIHIPWYGYACCALSYLLLVVLWIIFALHQINLYYLLFFIPLNFLIAKMCIRSEIFSFPATKYANLLMAYKRLAKDILAFQLDDPYFKQLQETINRQYSSLVRFSHMFEMLSYRKNILLSILGNGIFYLDYILGLKYNSFSKHLQSIQECLDAFSELEVMLSFAIIGLDNSIYCIPKESNQFEIVDGYHPLIKNCVSNSICLKEGIVLTGSNMSGKTTFMRMLGINQILANAGALVCASQFSTASYEVVTSLRANDMLQEGISTFYAEINRMKKIMEESQNKKTLVLVDEIFKGTNAKDRIYSAKEIIRKLNSYQVLFLITTHDFELCDSDHIQNYHFDEAYVDNKIVFDYQLKLGKCNKTNAIYLLKLAGVLD